MVVTLPRLNKCCFCVSLRTGSLIIGYLSILVSLFFISILTYSIIVVATFVKENKLHPNPEHPPEDVAKMALGIYVSQACYLLVYTFLIVISVMMIVGAHVNKPHLLRYYVISGFFLLGMAVALLVLTFVFVGFYATLPLLKWCVTHFICLLVVRSTQLEMEELNKPRVYEMQSLYSPPAPLNI